MSPRHVLLADLPGQARTVLRVTGDDAHRFLQGLLTGDLGQLAVGQAQPSALLTIKGKIVSEVIVLAPSESEIWLLVPAELAEAVQHQLTGHVIMDDVELQSLDLAVALIVEGAVGRDGAAGGDVKQFATQHPARGTLAVAPLADLRAALAGIAAIDDAEFTRARIDQGRPAWGHEIIADRFPPEVGFVEAVSYTKGCYLGQEPLSRIHNRGQVNRAMVRVESSAAPESSAPIALWDGEDPAGEWTSIAGQRGLAIVKRKFAKPGVVVRTKEGIEVTVGSGPIGEDAGGAGRTAAATVQLGKR